MRSRQKNKKGVTLIEVLIALVVMLIVFLGLTQAAFLSINHNMRNALRDEAVSLTSDQLSMVKSRSFDNTVSIATTPVRRQFRNIKDPANPALDFPFNVTVNVVDLDADTKQIRITTEWAWQDSGTIRHEIITTRRRGA